MFIRSFPECILFWSADASFSSRDSVQVLQLGNKDGNKLTAFVLLHTKIGDVFENFWPLQMAKMRHIG